MTFWVFSHQHQFGAVAEMCSNSHPFTLDFSCILTVSMSDKTTYCLQTGDRSQDTVSLTGAKNENSGV